jgi:hypothetical protein
VYLIDCVKILIVFIIRNLKNFYKFLISINLDNFYIPNFLIKNIIMINPNKIEYINSIPMKFYKSTKLISKFDWDKKNKTLKEYEKKNYEFVTCKELFIKKISIEKCKTYFVFKKKIQKFREFHGCKNHNDIILFLNKKISLYKNIKKNGVRKNLNSNIQFMIDRNQNLVKINSGNHRFAISRILNLKKIPVEVKLIHLNCFNKNSNKKIKLKDVNKIIDKVANKYT